MSTIDATRTPGLALPDLRRLPLLLGVGVVLLALLSGGTVTAIAASSGGTVRTGPAPAMEDDFLSMLNSARASRGLKALTRVEGVNNVAREWADVMARDNELKHRTSLRAPFDGNWRLLGENVGVGYSAESLHKGFMDSPGHRDNIMGDYDHVGIGVALSGSRAWVAFNFVKGDPDVLSAYRTNPLTGGYATGAGSGGAFYDLGDTVHRRDIEALDAIGAAASCASVRYCPDEPLRRSEMAVLLVRALDLPRAAERFTDVSSGHIYADEIGALAAAGITMGCNPPANDRFCPEEVVTRQQMASFFVRALDLRPTSTMPFNDVSTRSVHRNDIASLARSAITLGCNPPSNTKYCPTTNVTRGQMASFIARGLSL